VADHYPEAAALTLTEARARHFTERQEIAWQLRFAADPLDLRQLARRLQMGSV
jgi:hypothetical protein